MAKLPILPARDIVKAHGKAGFAAVSQRGSHIRLRGERGGADRTVIAPNYDENSRGVLSSIIRQAGMTRDEFLGLL